jgi:hypothetical protein
MFFVLIRANVTKKFVHIFAISLGVFTDKPFHPSLMLVAKARGERSNKLESFSLARLSGLV